MRCRDIVESKWWDDTPVIRLFHGTSSQFLPQIEQDGLQPPSEDLVAYALEVLEHYIPRDRWTDDLVQSVTERCARVDAGRAGDRGSVIYCFTDSESVEGYAESYAKHGGEIAYDVHNIASMFLAPNDISIAEFKRLHQLSPRFADATPIVVEIEVPKAWCLFDTDLDKLKKHIWQRTVDEEEALERYDSFMRRREVRVAKTVPVSMIRSIRKL